MKKGPYLLSIIFLSIALMNVLNAQKNIRAYVIDESTKESIPYAHVIKTIDKTGTITNDDGYFEIRCNKEDTLKISFLGYQDKFIPAAEIQNKAKIELSISTATIDQVTVYANNDFLYDMVDDVKKNIKKEKHVSKSKAYLFTSSKNDSLTLEVSELFYNASTKNRSIESLVYKNGRSYVLQTSNGGYFININISKSISMYSLLDKHDLFPTNPLELSKRKLKKLYKLEVSNRLDDLLEIKFTPKKDRKNLFSGSMWVHPNRNVLKKIELFSDGRGNKLFEGLHVIDINKINFSLILSYETEQNFSQLNFIKLNYNAEVSNHLDETFTVNTESILHLYDHNDQFFVPKIEYPEKISDYRLMTINPDTIIWNDLKKQNQIKHSQQQKDLLQNIKSNGKNFKEMVPDKENFFESSYEQWSPKNRILLKKNTKKIRLENSHDFKNRIAKTNFLSDKLEIETVLYLDILKTNDGFLFESSAIMDPYKTFNYLEVDDALLAYANIYFDLAEHFRRRLMNELETQDHSLKEIEEIYKKINKELSEWQAELKKEAFAGRNLARLKEWNTLIVDELGINNFDLFKIAQ